MVLSGVVNNLHRSIIGILTKTSIRTVTVYKIEIINKKIIKQMRGTNTALCCAFVHIIYQQ